MVVCGHICREYGHVCEYATGNGYCMITACIRHTPEPFYTTTWIVKGSKKDRGHILSGWPDVIDLKTLEPKEE